jgi:hypothetical protein
MMAAIIPSPDVHAVGVEHPPALADRGDLHRHQQVDHGAQPVRR